MTSSALQGYAVAALGTGCRNILGEAKCCCESRHRLLVWQHLLCGQLSPPASLQQCFTRLGTGLCWVCHVLNAALQLEIAWIPVWAGSCCSILVLHPALGRELEPYLYKWIVYGKQGSIRDSIKGYQWVLESLETSFSGFASGSFQSEGTNLNPIAISCPLSLTYFTRRRGGGIYRCWKCCGM